MLQTDGQEEANGETEGASFFGKGIKAVAHTVKEVFSTRFLHSAFPPPFIVQQSKTWMMKNCVRMIHFQEELQIFVARASCHERTSLEYWEVSNLVKGYQLNTIAESGIGGGYE